MTRHKAMWLACLSGTVLVVCTLLWMNRTEEATREILAAARHRWEESGVTSYTMELETLGAQTGTYSVTVKDGELVSLIRDGVAASPGNGSYWQVEGWFKIIEETLDHRDNPRSTAFPASSDVWVLVRINKQYGYPERFIRQVTGTSLGLEMRVLSFERME